MFFHQQQDITPRVLKRDDFGIYQNDSGDTSIVGRKIEVNNAQIQDMGLQGISNRQFIKKILSFFEAGNFTNIDGITGNWLITSLSFSPQKPAGTLTQNGSSESLTLQAFQYNLRLISTF